MVPDGVNHILRGTKLCEEMNESGDAIRKGLRDRMRER